MSLDDVVEECQATALSSQRTFTDTGKVAVGIKLQTIEHCHYTDILHPSVLNDGIKDDLTVGINILKLMPGDMFQESRDGEDGTGTKPATHVVARHVVEHRVVRDLKDIILQLFQRRHTRHLFLRLWITEDKIAKAHVLRHQMVEVDIHLRRVLIDKMEALSLSLRTIDGL